MTSIDVDTHESVRDFLAKVQALTKRLFVLSLQIKNINVGLDLCIKLSIVRKVKKSVYY